MLPLLDLFRLFLGASVLAFASYTDWRWRRAPDMLWWILAGVGTLFLGVHAWLDPAPWSGRWPYLLPLVVGAILVSRAVWSDVLSLVVATVGALGAFRVGFTEPGALTPAWMTLALVALLAVAIYAMWYTGLIAGGADAKALLAICVLLPFPLLLAPGIPWLPASVPGAMSVLGNSLLLFLAVPTGFLLWNLAHGDVRFPHLALGVKRRAADVQRGHQWPMELVDETGARRTKLFASRMSDEEIGLAFERVQALGDERVWVSPKIPFMLPLLGGFVSAFFVGDLLLWLLTRVRPLG